MAGSFISESGRLLDAVKRAALDAVEGYTAVTPYTIGVAVQAAARVLQLGASLGLEPEPVAFTARTRAIEVSSTEVTPRLRALESIARAATAAHSRHDDPGGCVLCAALVELEDLDAAS